MTRDLLPIGSFARLCRLSVKQLRHYDETGLLRPASVDPGTGYRYYARDQVRDAMAIALLRGLDVPLAVIGQVLAGDDRVRAEVLRAEQARLAERIAAQRRSWQLLDRLLTDGLLHREVSLGREPARRLLVRQAVCTPEEIGAVLTDCVGRLMTEVGTLRWTPPLWGLFPVDLGPEVRVRAAVEPVEPSARTTGTTVLDLPATPAALSVHVGPYEHLALTYQAVFAWIHERGLRPDGVVREAYLTDPGTTDPSQLVTRIVVPVHDEESS